MKLPWSGPSGWRSSPLAVRGPVPPHLADADDRNRFGKEVFHLTLDRISGVDKRKVWPCGEIAIEIAGALALFAKLARPTALDDETRQEMYALLRAVQRQSGVTALHVTHNISEARALADRLLVLRGGTISEGALKE